MTLPTASTAHRSGAGVMVGRRQFISAAGAGMAAAMAGCSTGPGPRYEAVLIDHTPDRPDLIADVTATETQTGSYPTPFGPDAEVTITFADGFGELLVTIIPMNLNAVQGKVNGGEILDLELDEGEHQIIVDSKHDRPSQYTLSVLDASSMDSWGDTA